MAIPDEPVPGVEPPAEEEEELIEILDDTPLADVPVTGDPALLYGAMMVASGFGLMKTFRKKKK